MKAEDVVVLDVSEVCAIAEHFVLATGGNARHVRAMAQEVIRQFKGEGILPLAREGLEEGTWAVVDYGPLLVHVFQGAAREFYDLEMLWGDGKKVRWRAPVRKKAAKKKAAAKKA